MDDRLFFVMVSRDDEGPLAVGPYPDKASATEAMRSSMLVRRLVAVEDSAGLWLEEMTMAKAELNFHVVFVEKEAV